MDVIKHRLENLETTVQQMYADKMAIQATINNLNKTVDSLKNVICDLEKELSGKVNVTDIQQVIKRSEVIKKINDSPSIGMDSAVRISLDGMVVAESVVEHTTDAIKISANDINGVNK
ncbi:hypothetical protein CON97_05580 [Bacillus pseudomycoides]|uniref:hypothetical protein n=1 Tax=Bacillus pseudomycoides TaxID=64104 RepID=UPI000BEB5F2E|nr:hypothetical protein [Bacillus pseudomycoides]PED73076.1 hypothetical protein CON97_05580 [Bacillus pseudomycoides]